MLCKNCGHNMGESNFCPNCGVSAHQNQPYMQYQSQPQMKPLKRKRWYEKTGVIILFLIFFFPVGLCLMWMYAGWKQPVKVILTVIVAVSIIGALQPWNYIYDTDVFSEADSSVTSSNSVPSTASGSVSGNEISKEDYKAMCQSVDYKTIARDPKAMKGDFFTFKGEVVQVIAPTDLAGTTIYHVNVTQNRDGSYEDTIVVEFRLPNNSTRILEGDIVTIWGKSKGFCSYRTVINTEVTVPKIDAEYITIHVS